MNAQMNAHPLLALALLPFVIALVPSPRVPLPIQPTRAAPSRSVPSPRSEESGVGGGWFGRLTSFFADEVETAEARAAVEAICRPSGWRVRCSIGSDVARALGGYSLTRRMPQTDETLTRGRARAAALRAIHPA